MSLSQTFFALITLISSLGPEVQGSPKAPPQLAQALVIVV